LSQHEEDEQGWLMVESMPIYSTECLGGTAGAAGKSDVGGCTLRPSEMCGNT
jgi:hypothetical protein